jgi:hypothetical protein
MSSVALRHLYLTAIRLHNNNLVIEVIQQVLNQADSAVFLKNVFLKLASTFQIIIII